MRLFYIFIIVIFFGFPLGAQGPNSVDYPALLQQLQMDLKQGNHRAMRDLISLIDEPSITTQIRKTLYHHTFFTNKEIDVQQASKALLMDFYYNNASALQYSELLQAYYLTPVEQQKVAFEIRYVEDSKSLQVGTQARRLINDLQLPLEKRKIQETQNLIAEIVDLEIPDRELYLNLLRDHRLLDFPEYAQADIYQSLLTALEPLADLEITEIGLQIAQGDFCSPEYIKSFLTKVTNNTADVGYAYENDVDYYYQLIDSLGTFQDIRSYGYEKVYPFRMNFFQYPVDYYGKLLGRSEDYPWITHNALLDLQRSQHPRAFFYIIAHWYREWKKDPEYSHLDHFDLCASMTNASIGVKNSKGEIVFDPQEDEQAMLNYFLYWAANYHHYEWDKNRKIFTNKLETLAKTQNYERLFRRLNSKNDTIALLSFVQLTEGDPIEVKKLAKKYRPLLRKHNASLPKLKYKYLEQLSQLTHFCAQNQFSYQVRPELASKLHLLLEAGTASQRYQIENDIIAVLSLADLTPLEYWACLKAQDKEVAFSVGRILDWAYTKHWSALVKDQDMVRLYLKKASLFEGIGVSGTCNNYLNKFDIQDAAQRDILIAIGNLETDEDILHQISMLMSQVEAPAKVYSEYNISEFLQNPMIFNKRDLKTLPVPTPIDVRKLVDRIKLEKDSEIIRKLFSYLWMHPNLEYVPVLFELIDDQRIITQRVDCSVTIADNVIPIIENVYDQHFPIDSQQVFATNQWRQLWKEDGTNFKKWKQVFFEQKLDSLDFFEELRIDQINALTESDYYSEAYKEKILKQIHKVRPLRNIRRLSIEPKLSVKEDLKYFDRFFFSYKELDDIPKLFDVKDLNASLMLDFIQEKATTFDGNEKGSLYNNLFRAPWLGQFISNGLMERAMADSIQITLETYLQESEFMSEYEEQVTLLNIAQLQFMGRSIEEKIDGTLQLPIDNAAKAKVLNSIIATISYHEIPLVMERLDQLLEVLGPDASRFLSTDFGIPVFGFNTLREQEQFLNLHRSHTEEAFYRHYLKEFGLEIMTPAGDLDFEKIYELLIFDIVSPFTGETGGKRDWYTFGLIKLLEHHFGTRLGFHEKLNESQTFYSFSSSKRAIAWQAYLIDNGLVNPDGNSPISFNTSSKE